MNLIEKIKQIRSKSTVEMPKENGRAMVQSFLPNRKDFNVDKAFTLTKGDKKFEVVHFSSSEYIEARDISHDTYDIHREKQGILVKSGDAAIKFEVYQENNERSGCHADVYLTIYDKKLGDKPVQIASEDLKDAGIDFNNLKVSDLKEIRSVIKSKEIKKFMDNFVFISDKDKQEYRDFVSAKKQSKRKTAAELRKANRKAVVSEIKDSISNRVEDGLGKLKKKKDATDNFLKVAAAKRKFLRK